MHNRSDAPFPVSPQPMLAALSRPFAAIPWRLYAELCKLKVVGLILFTAAVGMLLAAPAIALDRLFWALLGIALGAASGAAANHVADAHIDARMARTHRRPLPSGRMERERALAFAVALGLLSMAILTLFVNLLTALLTLASLVGYAVVYTLYLKRATPWNIVWGGAAGATPPLLGWAAATGGASIEAFVLFLLIFIWTPPHFWALAIQRRAEYARASVPMLPVVYGVAFTKQQILLYALSLFAASLLPFLVQMSGLLYLIGAVALGAEFVRRAWRLYRSQEGEDDRPAGRMFSYSIVYLALLFFLLLADRYGGALYFSLFS